MSEVITMSEPSVPGTGGRLRFGFDIGGTFTDFVLLDIATGTTTTYKTLTTPNEPARAVLEGWNELVTAAGTAPDQVELSVHGTTLITNALIERQGARTGLLTTRGFRDTLEMRREMRYDIYDLLITLPEPLVPRPLRLEADERIDHKGEIRESLDPESLAGVAAAFAEAGVEAVAICFLHAFTNSVHEQLAGEWLRKALPGVTLSLSSEVAPEIREFERTSTTVANAYVQPLAEQYLLGLQRSLAEVGFTRTLHVMLSNGGITTLDTASRFPIRLVESGPAAGVLAAARHGVAIDTPNVVSFDMGGTTAKMCLVKNGLPAMSNTFEIARVHRFKRGSGLPVQVRAIDLIEIGAGGGSIARVDDLGLLKVGPSSAGAAPGPACYDLGGTLPTVTDADLVLGYLNPDNFLGGRMKLSAQAAEAAIASEIAEGLQMTVTEAAYGIHTVVNESMVSATRIHVAERGADVRKVFLMAFGGAGPVHADAIARSLRMPGYIVPPAAGVNSALGFLAAPTSFELARSVTGALTAERLADLDALFSELEAEGLELLQRAEVPSAEMTFTRRADLRYSGQGHELVLDLPSSTLSSIDLERDVVTPFHAAHTELYGHAHTHLGLEIVALRLTASGPEPPLTFRRADDGDAATEVPHGTRLAYFHSLGGFVETPVYQRSELPAGAVSSGPAIIEENDSTTIVGPDAELSVHALGHLVVRFAQAA
jgi:N-methylhydantoinase A